MSFLKLITYYTIVYASRTPDKFLSKQKIVKLLVGRRPWRPQALQGISIKNIFSGLLLLCSSACLLDENKIFSSH